MFFQRCATVLALIVPACSFGATPISDFAHFASFEQVSISPKGDYVAARVHFKDGFGLAVIRLADNKMTATVSMGPGRDLYRYTWVSPTRLVLEPAKYEGGFERPHLTGELIGVNADGTDQAYLFGYRASNGTGTLVHHYAQGGGVATVIEPLPEDSEHAIVEVNDWGTSDTTVSRACKLNVVNGMLSDCVSPPSTGFFGFLVDNNGQVRYATSSGDDYQSLETFIRNPGDSEWHRLSSKTAGLRVRTQPLKFSKDNSKVYLSSDEGGDRYCLVEQTVATGELHELSCDPVADLSLAVFSFDGNEPIAALYDVDRPKLVYVNTGNQDVKVLQQLQASFPGDLVRPVSRTTDGSKVVLYVYSDRDPGGYYLLDTKSLKVSPLVARMDDIVPDEMAERRPVAFKARDGQMIHGFLTIPPGRELKDLPLVVHPHGGPFGVADEWEWDATPQLLATHGYAVLQVNFRGSDGYGKGFLDAGYKAWGTTMINDIADGTNWVVEQGFADAKRICIFGGSYGGYASLMSAVRFPDLYRCAVGYAGVYDLNLWKKHTDVSDTSVGLNYITRYVGSSDEELKAQSPLTYIDRLKASIMIVHGTDDDRVPFDQAKALRSALEAQHHPYEWLEKSGEGHGFFKEENRVELYTRLLQFLDKNIGSVSPDAKAAADSSAK